MRGDLPRRLDAAAASLHFRGLDGAAAAAAEPEDMMGVIHLIAGRHLIACAALAAGLLLACGLVWSADPFPFDRELLLDAAPMRPAKRMPSLTVTANGDAIFDLWCKSVSARVDVSDAAIKIEPGPLPEALPAMMGAGQCTPQRMRADEDMLAVLAQMTEWRRQGGALVLVGPKTLKFRAATN
ncbi:MAG: META domain-containing protein [Rhizobiales bacterium]|nr:META domain-containing protein [Hyphomicrobiales bacterium]